jgi:hypothetical protein
MIRSKEFWLRNVRCMNDYSEVEHGIGLLIRIFGENNNARRDRLTTALDKIAAGAATEGIADFDKWIPTLPGCVFIGCLSQYDPNDEYGRLSMWRAYAQGAGVALVLNNDPFVAETDLLKAYSLPVAYLSDQQFADGIDRCLDVIEQNIEQMRILNYDVIRFSIFWWLLTLAVGQKHPAFVEEKEWRVIYLPNLWKSPVISEHVETIGGIPQIVQKIPLKHDPDSGLFNANIENLIDKIIVGPSEYPIILSEAFVAELEKNGVADAASKVVISYIPLRG